MSLAAAIPLVNLQEAGAYPQDPPGSGTMAAGVSAVRAYGSFSNGWDGNWTYPCNDVYSVNASTGLYRFTNLDAAAASRTAANTQVATMTFGNSSTLALGSKPDGTGVMYFWYWGGRAVYEIPSGSTTATTPAPGTSVTYTVPAAVGGYGSGYYSGGEVDQTTGNIIFSGAELANFGNGYRMMIFNPQTGEFKQSGRITATPGTNTSQNIDGTYIASDMAVDADGNMYVVVGSGTLASTSPGWWLVRVVPNETQAWQPWSQRTSATAGTGWRYNKVVKLNGSATVGPYAYGMAFHNGMLYAVGNGNTQLLEINPITGLTRNIGAIGRTTYDLGGCEVAPVIEGNVYIDANGDGVISETEMTEDEAHRLGGATVELYSSTGVLLGTQATSSIGSFSFLLDNANADYYIRLVRPTDATGLQGHQTWANQATKVPLTANGVTPYCVDASGTANPLTAPGACYGANLTGSDPAGSLSGVAAITSQAGIYSKIEMTTDKDVAKADFGVTFSNSWGDAPDTYKTTKAAGGPRYIVLADSTAPSAMLGSRVVAYPDGAPSTTASNHDADGVQICNVDGSACQPLQGASIVPGKHYKFVIHTTHTVDKANVWISGWIGGWSPSATAPSGTWLTTTPILTNQHPNDFGDYEVLDWTAPDASVSGPFWTFARFRVTVANSAPSSTPDYQAPTATSAWAPVGEVEDYAVNVANGKTQIGVRTIGEGSGAGSFTFTATNTSDTHTGVLGSFSSTAALSTSAAMSTTWDARLHAVSTIGTPVNWRMVVSGTSKVWTIGTVTCTDGGTAVAGITKDPDGRGFSIPGSAITTGADISCLVELVTDPDPANSVLELMTTNPVVADGVAVHTLRATINGPTLPPVPMSGVTVSWVISDKGSTLPTTALPPGVAQQTCVSNTSGQCSISFSYDGALPDTDVTKHFDVHASVATATTPAAAITGSPKEVIFRSGPVCTSPNTSNFWVTPKPPSVVSTNTGTAQVHVAVRDCQGHGIPDYDVSKLMWFTSDSLGSFSPGASAFTLNTAGVAGEYVADIKSSVIGDKTIQAKFEVPGGAWVSGISVPPLASSDPLKNEVARFATVDPPCTSPVTSTYWVEPATDLVVGNGADNRAKVYVAVRDCSGNPLASYDTGRLKWHTDDPLGSSGGSPAPNGSAFTSTGTDGVFVADLYSYAAGNKAVEVRFESTAAWPSGTLAVATEPGHSNTIAHYVPGAPDPTTTTFWVEPIPPAVTAVTTGTANVYVTVRDSFGNGVPGYAANKLVWHTDQPIGSSPNGTPFVAVSGTTGLFVAEIKSGADGDKTIGVKADSTDGTWATGTVIGVDTTVGRNNAVARFEAGGPCTSPITSTYWVEPDTDIVVGPTHKATVYLHLRDCAGNDVPASKVPAGSLAWQIASSESLGGGTVTAFALQSGTVSTYVAEFYSTVAGDKHVAARFNISGGVWASGVAATATESGKPNTIAHYIAEDTPNPTTSTYWVTPKTEVNVGTGTAYVYVQLRDSYDNPIIGYDAAKLAWQTTASLGGSPTTSAFASVSGQPGQFVAEIKSTLPGDKPIQARFGVTGGVWATGTAVSAAAAGDPLKNETAKFGQGVNWGPGSYFEVTTGPKVVETGTHTVTVHLLDESGIPLTGKADSLSASSVQTLRATGDTTIGRITAFTEAPAGSGIYTATIYSTSWGEKVIKVAYTAASVPDLPYIEDVAPPGAGPEDVTHNNVARFQSGTPDLSHSSYSVASAAVVAGTSAAVTAIIRDKWDNPVTGQVAQLGLPTTTDPISTGTFTGHGDAFTELTGVGNEGQYRGGLTSYLTGAKTVTVTFGGSALSYAPPGRVATFVAGGVDVTNPNTYFKVTTGPQAITTGSHTVTAYLVDQYGNAVTGQTSLNWSVTDEANPLDPTPIGSFSPTAFTETPAASGTYTATIKSSKSGTKIITVKFGSDSVSNRANNDRAVFEAGPVDPTKSRFWVPETIEKTVKTETHLVYAFLRDAAGNPASGHGASLAATPSAPGPLDFGVTGGITSFSEVPGTPGLYQATIDSEKAGTFIISVTYSGTNVTVGTSTDTPPGNGNREAKFKAGPPRVTPYSHYTVTTGYRTVGGAGAHTITVRVTDQFDNGLTGMAGYISASVSPDSSILGAGSISTFTATTAPIGSGDDGLGYYQASITSTLVGDKPVLARLDAPGAAGSIGLKPGGNSHALFQAGAPSVPNSYYSVSTGSVSVAGGSHTITVVLRDGYNNVVPETTPPTLAGNILLTTTDLLGSGSITLPAVHVGAGVYTSTITSSVIGSKNITAQYSGAGIPAGPAVGANTAALFDNSDCGSNQSWYWVDDATAKPADNVATHTVNVFLADTAGNGCAGRGATLTRGGTNLAGSTFGVVNDLGSGNYSYTISASVAGDRALTVGYGATPLPVRVVGGTASNSTARFVAGPVVPGNSIYTVSLGSVPVGATHTVTVTLKDATGNVVSRTEEAARLFASVGSSLGEGVSFGSWTAVTDGDGNPAFRATISSTKAGAKPIIVKYGTSDATGTALTYSVNGTAQFQAGPIDLTKSWFQVSTGPQVVGSGSHTVTVSLADTYGNPVTLSLSELSGLTATPTPNLTVSVSSFTPVSGTPGQYTATVQSNRIGGKTITVSYGGNVPRRDIGGTPANDVANFVAGPYSAANSSWIVVSDLATPVGSTHTLRVTVQDTLGNPISGQGAMLFGSTTTDLLTTVTGFVETGTGTGIYEATIATTLAGNKLMTVAYDHDANPGTPVVAVGLGATGHDLARFAAGPPSWTESYYTVGSDTVAVGGNVGIDIFLMDQYKNPISGRATSFNLNTISGTLPVTYGPVTEVPGEPGHYRSTVSSTAAGDKVVGLGYGTIAPYQVVTYKTNQTAHFDTAVCSAVTYWVTPDVKTVGTGASNAHTVFAVVTDTYNNRCNSTALNYDVAGGIDSGVKSPFTAAGPTGVYTATVTSTVSGSHEVTVRLGSATYGTVADATVSAVVGGVLETGNSNKYAQWKSDAARADQSYFWVTTGTKTVGLADDNAHIVQVLVRDQYGNPVVGQAGNIAVTSTDYGLGGPGTVGESGTAGVYSVLFKSTVSGDKNINVTLGGTPLSPGPVAESRDNRIARFAPGAPDINNPNSKYWVVSSDVREPVVETHTVRVQLADSYGNLVTVSPSILFGRSELSLGTGRVAEFSGTAGIYDAVISSSVDVNAPIRVRYDTSEMSVRGGDNSLARFRATTANPGTSSFWVSTGDKLVGGTEYHTIYVKLRSSGDGPVTGQQASLSAQVVGGVGALRGDGDSTIGRIGTFTEVTPGNYEARVYSTKIGAKQVSVRWDDGSAAAFDLAVDAVNTNYLARFVINPTDPPCEVGAGVSCPKQYYSVDTVSKVIGNTVPVWVHLTDSWGNDLTGAASAIRAATTASLGLSGNISTFTAMTTPPAFAPVDQPTGWYQANVLSSDSPGDKPITVRILATSSAIALGGNFNDIARFTRGTVCLDPADCPGTDVSYFEVTTGDALVNTGSHTVTVKLFNIENGAAIGGQAGYLTWATVDDLGSFSTTAFTEGTGANVGTYTATIQSSASGAKVITTALTGVGAIKHGTHNDTATFKAGTVDPTKSSFWVTTGDKTVKTEQHTVTVVLRDAAGNLAPGLASQIHLASAGLPTGEPPRAPGDGFGTGYGIGPVVESTVTPGVYTVAVTSSLSGSWRISGTYGAGATAAALKLGTTADETGATGNDIAKFVAGLPDWPTHVWMTVTTGDKVVGTGVANQHTITVFIGDDAGNGIGGQVTKLSTATATGGIGGGTISGWTAQSGADIGKYTATITSTEPGDKVVSATWDGTAYGTTVVDIPAGTAPNDNKTARFIADTICVPLGSHGSYSVTTGEVATNTGIHKVTVELRDCYNNLTDTGVVASTIHAASVETLGTGGIGTFSKVSQGVYAANITSSIDGDKHISATYGSETVAAGTGANTIATFTSLSPPEPSESWFEVSTGEVVANNIDTHTITVTLRDADGNLLSGKVSGLTASPTPAAGVTVVLPFTEATALGVGKYTTTVRSLQSGNKTITVRYGGEEIAAVIPMDLPGGGTALNNIAAFKAGPPVLGESQFTVSLGTQVVVTGTHTVTVLIKDGNRNPVKDKELALTPSADPAAGVTFGAFTEGPDGTYVANITSTSAGTKQIKIELDDGAVVGEVPFVTNRNAEFVAGPPDPAFSWYEVSTGIKIAGKQTHTVTVHFEDSEHNPVTGLTPAQLATIYPTAAPSTGFSFGSFAATSTDGEYAATISSVNVGSTTVSIRYGTEDVHVRVVAGVDQNKVAVFGPDAPDPGNSGYRVTEGNEVVLTGSHTITVTLRDDRNQPVSDAAASLVPSAPSGDLGDGLITGFVPGTAPGTYTAIVTSSKSGAVPITVTYTGSTPPTTLSAENLGGGVLANTTARFVAGPPCLNATDPGCGKGNVSSYTVTADDRVVTATHDVTVTMVDGEGNGVTGLSTKLFPSLVTPDGTVSFGPFVPVTGSEGVYRATVGSTTIGNKDVVVKYGETAASAAAVTYQVNRTARFIADEVDYSNSAFWVTTGTKFVGTAAENAHTVTAILRDGLNNPVTGLAASLTREFTGSIGSGVFSTFVETATDGTYTATITSTAIGSKSITVKQAGVSLLVGDATVGGTGNRLARFVVDPDKPPCVDTSECPAPSWFGVTKGEKLVGTDVTINGHTITVSLVDKDANPITGVATKLSAAATGGIGGGTVSVFTETIDPGVYTATVTSTNKGAKPISVTWTNAGTTVAIVDLPPAATGIDNHVANFKVNSEGPVCLTDPATKFSVTEDVRVVGLTAGAGHVVTVQLADCYGNLITDYDVSKLTWQTDDDLGLGTITAFTESSVEGQYTARIRSTVDGNKVIRAVDVAGSIPARGANTTARFKSGPPVITDPELANFEVTTGEVPVYTGTHTVTIKLYDEFHNGVRDVEGLLEATATPSTAVSVGAIAPVAGHPGWYSAAITSTSVGIKTIAVKYSGESVFISGYGTAAVGNDKARFKAGPVDPTTSAFYVSTGDQFVGTGTHTITVELKDADNNGVLGAAGLLSRTAVPSAGVTLSAFTETATSGTYTATVRSTVPGVKTVGVTYDGTALSPRTAAENKASFITDPDGPCLDCEGTGYSVTSGTVPVTGGSHIVTVTLVDEFGNGVVGAAGKLFPRTVASSLGTGSIAAFTPVAGADGVYQAVITSSVSGDKQIKVRFGNAATGAEIGADGNDLARFGSGTVDVSASDYWVAPGPQVVNTTAQVRVHLVDVAGNAATGEAAGLTAYTTDDLGLPPTLAFSSFTADGTDGWYVATVKSLKSGLKTIHVRYGGVDIATVTTTHGNTTTFTAETIIDPTNEYTFYSVSTGNNVVLEDPHVVTVQIADQYGNLISGSASTLSATLRVGQSIGTGTISAFLESATPGIYTANVSSSVAGGKNLQAKVTLSGSTYNIALNGNGLARFIPGAFDPNNSKSGFTVSTGLQMVGSGTHTVEARLADINGNLIGGKADVLTAGTTFDIGTGTITAFEQLTDEDGPYYVAYITSTKAGAKAISVALDGTPLTPRGNQQARFRASGPWVDNPATSFSVTDGTRKVGTGLHTVTITVADRYGNPVSDAEAQLWIYVLDDIGEGSITEPVEDATEPGTYTAQISSTKAGGKQVTVQIGVRTVHHGTNNDIATFVAGDPDRAKSSYRVSEGDQPIITGSHTVTVKLADQYTNPVTGHSAKLDATTRNDLGSGTISAFVESTKTPGTYTATITSSKPGAKVVAVEHAESGPITLKGNDTANFTSSVDVTNAGTRYWVTEGVQPPVTGVHTVTIQLADAGGNPLAGAAGDIHIAVAGDIGTGKIGTVKESSVTPGTYTATLTSSVYGTKAVTVTYGEDSEPVQLGGNGNDTADFGTRPAGTPSPLPTSPGLAGTGTPRPGGTLPFTGADVAIPAAIAGLLLGLGGLLFLTGALRKRRRGDQTEEAAA